MQSKNEWVCCGNKGTKSEKRKPTKPLKVPEGTEVASKDEVLAAQSADESLSKIWNLAEKGDKRISINGNGIKLVKIDGMLYQVLRWEEATSRQLAVPTQFKDTVLKLAHDSPMSG